MRAVAHFVFYLLVKYICLSSAEQQLEVKRNGNPTNSTHTRVNERGQLRRSLEHNDNIVRLDLFNVETDEKIAELTEGYVVDLDKLGLSSPQQISIEAIVSSKADGIQSVNF
jgi:hypothetical protein